MVLCPQRCGKPGPNKISVKQRGRRQAALAQRKPGCGTGQVNTRRWRRHLGRKPFCARWQPITKDDERLARPSRDKRDYAKAGGNPDKSPSANTGNIGLGAPDNGKAPRKWGSAP